MRRAVITISAACMLSFLSSPRPASAVVDGNLVNRACRDLPDFCTAFISGMAEIDAYTGGKLTCAPNGIENSQIVDVVSAYLRNHPEKRHLPMARIYVDAMRQAFPCSGRRS